MGVGSMPLRVRALIWREGDMYVARGIVTGVTSQGKTIEEALENLREALELTWRKFQRHLKSSANSRIAL